MTLVDYERFVDAVIALDLQDNIVAVRLSGQMIRCGFMRSSGYIDSMNGQGEAISKYHLLLCLARDVEKIY